MKQSTVIAVLLSCTLGVGGGAALAADAEQIRVFDATELPLHRYEVVKRIWTQTWHASFWVSTHDEAADAIAALTRKAADAGANGVINLHCLNDTGGWSSNGYFCHGLAIKLK
jgi:hypothetical protein